MFTKWQGKTKSIPIVKIDNLTEVPRETVANPNRLIAEHNQ